MEHVLEVKDVSKKINGKTLVENISFQLHAGEIVGLLGPNGAGKTTILKMLVGLSSASRGEIYINGCNIKKDFNKAIMNIGAIIETPGFYPYLSGYDNLVQFYKMTFKKIDDHKIIDILKLLGLMEAKDKKVKTYSLGMKQRLGIAQALLHEPSIIILDEPTNGLDPLGIQEMREYLRAMATKGMTIFISSHLLSEIEILADRVIVIANGKLIKENTLKKEIHMTTKLSYVLEVSDTEAAVEHIETSAEITTVDNGNKTVTIFIEKNKIPAILEILILNKVKVYSVQQLAESLENEFIQLTKNEVSNVQSY